MRTTLAAVTELSNACVSALRKPPVSVILHGSLAAGGFTSGKSDVDLLIIVDGALADADIAALTSAVQAAELTQATGVDLLVVDVACSVLRSAGGGRFAAQQRPDPRA